MNYTKDKVKLVILLVTWRMDLLEILITLENMHLVFWVFMETKEI
jgi:hypothetical protein